MSRAPRYKKDAPVITNPAPWVKLARILASEQKLSMEFEKQDQPRIDLANKVIYVPKPTPYMSPREQMEWAGRVYHEIGHAAPECRDIYETIIKHKLDMSSLLGMVVNMLDDYRQEKTNHGVYPGRDMALCAIQTWAARNGAARNSESDLSGAVDDTRELCTNLFFWYYTMRSTWQRDITAHVGAWELLATEKARDLVKYTPEVEALVGADGEAVYNLAVKILAESTGKSEEQIQQESQSDSDGPRGEDGEELSEAEKEAVKAAVKAAREALAHQHKESKEESEYNTPNQDTTHRKEDRRKYQYSGEYAVRSDFAGKGRFLPSMTKAYDSVQGLAGTVRKLLQAKTQQRYQGGYRRGRLNSRALHRSATDNTSVFKQRIETTSTDVAVQLVVDCSGSMSGTRYVNAAAASAALVEALQPNNIKVEVIGFSHEGYGAAACSIMYPFKPFSERTDPATVLERMGSDNVELMNNADGEALLWCAPRLEQQQVARKVMIVLSDGQPASDIAGNENAFLGHVAATLEKRFEVYAIGIESDSVSEFYTEHAVLDNVSQLNDCLLNLIKNKIVQ